MNLKKYRKELLHSCKCSALWGIPIFLIWLVLYTPLKNRLPFLHSLIIDKSMRYGATGGLIGYFVFLLGYFFYTVVICRNTSLLENHFLKNHDERQKFIINKTSDASFRISLLVLLLCSLIAEAFNPVIFFTLYAVLVLLVIVYGLCKLYYLRKY